MTKKGSEFPSEVTKCRNMDKSIVANIINKMRGKIEKTYTNFKVGDKKHNKEAFNSMLEINLYVRRMNNVPLLHLTITLHQ